MAVKAVVIVKADAVLTERDVMRNCQLRLERFMVLEAVIFVDELPKPDTGKIKNTGLRWAKSVFSRQARPHASHSTRQP